MLKHKAVLWNFLVLQSSYKEYLDMPISISSKARAVVWICLVSVTEKKNKKGLAKTKIQAGMESSSNGESFAFPWHNLFIFLK